MTHTETDTLRDLHSLAAMDTSSILIVCILVTCSVWTIHGRSIKVNIDDQEPGEMEISVEAGKLPGVCWACKWALNKVKKTVGRNATAEKLKSKLMVVCNKIGLLKSLCRKFVKSHLPVLIEELTTTDDVRTICVNTKACKPKELLHQVYQSDDGGVQIQINEYPEGRMHG
ncbi:antimicrobial peptide NK-lysin-like [Trematomus bernacchii]|uniref:antimicrobial peptide NK-lysin-like n=1 Tax=Trematomus bernacchii TaxID=40690 RepID=UPI00146A623A|nr:antimicrobial peptide NK-lysin-like [Trematomus bernacchii]